MTIRKIWLSKLVPLIGERKANTIEKYVYKDTYGDESTFSKTVRRVDARGETENDSELLKLETTSKRNYSRKLRKLYSNLTNVGNPGLLKNVRRNRLSVKTLLTMSHEEMFPDRWRKTREWQQREIRKIREHDEMITYKSSEKCKKCGKHCVVPFELQTRSADESMTVFYQCTDPSCQAVSRR